MPRVDLKHSFRARNCLQRQSIHQSFFPKQTHPLSQICSFPHHSTFPKMETRHLKVMPKPSPHYFCANEGSPSQFLVGFFALPFPLLGLSLSTTPVIAPYPQDSQGRNRTPSDLILVFRNSDSFKPLPSSLATAPRSAGNPGPVSKLNPQRDYRE